MERKSSLLLVYTPPIRRDQRAAFALGMVNPEIRNDFPIKDTLKVIKQCVKENGTLSELRIGGHGSSQRIYAPDNSYLRTDALLDKLQDLQNSLGIKIADKITFMACNVFTDLKPGEVKNYREKAKALNCKISGSSELGFVGLWQVQRGKYVQFLPDGSVSDDMFLTNRGGPLAIYHLLGNAVLGGDDSWVDHHLERTQESGERSQLLAETVRQKGVPYPPKGDKFQRTLEQHTTQLQHRVAELFLAPVTNVSIHTGSDPRVKVHVANEKVAQNIKLYINENIMPAFKGKKDFIRVECHNGFCTLSFRADMMMSVNGRSGLLFRRMQDPRHSMVLRALCEGKAIEEAMQQPPLSEIKPARGWGQYVATDQSTSREI